MSDEIFLDLDVLEDPEMRDIGQRLIVQGGEFLDDADLEGKERQKIEKVFSDCWEDLRDIKICKEALLKILQTFRQGQIGVEKEAIKVVVLLKEFLKSSIEALEDLIRIVGPLTQGEIMPRSFKKNRLRLCESLSHCGEGIKQVRCQALAKVIKEGELNWIGTLISFYEQVEKAQFLEKEILLKEGPLLKNGHHAVELLLKNGSALRETVLDLWRHLVSFCEVFVAHAIQLRFYEYVQGLEIIPQERQDLIYPRRFKIVLNRPSPLKNKRGGWKA